MRLPRSFTRRLQAWNLDEAMRVVAGNPTGFMHSCQRESRGALHAAHRPGKGTRAQTGARTRCSVACQRSPGTHICGVSLHNAGMRACGCARRPMAGRWMSVTCKCLGKAGVGQRALCRRAHPACHTQPLTGCLEWMRSRDRRACIALMRLKWPPARRRGRDGPQQSMRP